jgi:hypothetical protein
MLPLLPVLLPLSQPAIVMPAIRPTMSNDATRPLSFISCTLLLLKL